MAARPCVSPSSGRQLFASASFSGRSKRKDHPSPATIGIEPGAGDEGRPLSGCARDVSGARGDSGVVRTKDAVISWWAGTRS
ncbi:hypothetical protein [Streptomyces amakusaensis]|uniref:Uncharacterized protein n=1 Tax=Streptomyces amakusaensis TaxID=67271 RepID=A0ABW0AD78_9ACTN